jgi:uncharacterized protein (DUF1800 family)
MNKSFFRKVAFGLSPDDVIPTDPLTWAQNQFDTVPEILWPNEVESLDVLTELHGEYRNASNQLIYKKFDSFEDFNQVRQDLWSHYRLEELENNELKIRHYNAIFGNQPAYERMIHFWGNHFCITGKDDLRSFATGPFHREVIRPNMIKTFEDLVFEATISHAMQINLDNWLNCGPSSLLGKGMIKNDKIKNPLNENHARELLELHTISSSAGYTQEDVIEVTKILTGWGVKQDYRGRNGKNIIVGPPEFKNSKWEPGVKVFMGKEYKVKAKEELRTLIKDLVNMDICKQFISTKLCKHFVSDDPSENEIQFIVKVWNDTNGSLPDIHKAVMKVAYESATSNSEKVIPPEVWFLQIGRMFNVNIPGKMKGEQYFDIMENLGHHPYRSRQPNGYSDFSEDWISTEHMLRRLAYVRFLHRYIESNSSEDFLISVLDKNFDKNSEMKSMLELRLERFKEKKQFDSSILSIICSGPEFLKA